MPTRRLAVVLLCLVGSAISVPVAKGAVQGVARTDDPKPREVTGLSLAGDAVVWGDLPAAAGAKRVWTVRLARTASPARVKFASRVPRFTSGSLAASPDYLAVSADATAQGASRLFAGPLDGPLQRVDEGLYAAKPLGWSGTLLATTEIVRQSAGLTGRFALRDASNGFAPRHLGEPPSSDLRIAGDRIALATPVNFVGRPEGRGDLRLDVARLDDGQTEYSITLEDTERVDFDLQGDGKLAWLNTGGLRADGRPTLHTLAWASPTEPWVHPLTTAVSFGALRVRLRDDHVVFARPGGGSHQQYSFQPWITDLAGAARPIWFPLPPAAGSDFDGTDLAVAAGGCIWRGNARDRLSGPPAGVCPQQVTGEGTRRISRGGSRYVYAFPCLMAPRGGCEGVARLEVAKRARGRRKVVAVRRFRARQGQTARVRFAVRRRKLHAMRNRNGNLWLFATVHATDSAALTSISESYPFVAQP